MCRFFGSFEDMGIFHGISYIVKLLIKKNFKKILGRGFLSDPDPLFHEGLGLAFEILL